MIPLKKWVLGVRGRLEKSDPRQNDLFGLVRGKQKGPPPKKKGS